MDDKRHSEDLDWTGLADTLRNRVEPYQEGAWERFVSRVPDSLFEDSGAQNLPSPSKVRRLHYRVWMWRAAAILLLMSIGLYFWNSTDSEQVLLTSTTDSRSPSATEEVFNQKESQLIRIDAQDTEKPKFPASSIKINRTVVSLASHKLLAEAKGEVPLVPDSAAAKDPVEEPRASDVQLLASSEEFPQTQISQESVELEKPAVAGDPVREVAERLAALDAQLPRTDVESPITSDFTVKKWDVGLVLSSAFTTEQLNLAGGVRLAYQVTDKLTLRSGISLGEFGVNAERSGLATTWKGSEHAMLGPAPHPSLDKDKDATPVYYTRQLNSITSNLLTMDVPIDLSYAWTNRFYTSVGVSYLGVLNETRVYHFIDHINEPMFAGEASAGNDISNSVLASYVNERASERPLDGKGYAGFLNLSIGHRTPITKKLNVSFEPFFKLPIGRLAKEDMNLTNGGIRIVTGF